MMRQLVMLYSIFIVLLSLNVHSFCYSFNHGYKISTIAPVSKLLVKSTNRNDIYSFSDSNSDNNNYGSKRKKNRIGSIYKFSNRKSLRISLTETESLSAEEILDDEIALAVTTEPKKDEDYEEIPPGTQYIMCTTCKTAYIFGEKDLDKQKGKRVKCSVCEREWFQSTERLMETNDIHFLRKMPVSRVTEIKKIISEKNYPRYPRVDKVGVFVGNLPYAFTEEEIGDIFGEYGITNIALVRDNEGKSKGFAFVEVYISNQCCSSIKYKIITCFY